jgi:hypothetical protein
MTGPEERQAPLPARPAADSETTEFAPRFPWKYVALAALTVVLVIGGHLLKEARRAAQLRAEILNVHQELEQPRAQYFAFRDKVEKLMLSASTGAKAPEVDQRLRIEGLRSGRGLYLRLRAQDLKDAKSLAAGAAATEQDVINACMGLAPVSARGLWAQGAFLSQENVEEAKKERSVMHLRVLDEMLARKIRTDLPAVLTLTKSDWLLLIVQQGVNRRDQPVDVFLWDLRSDQKLLSARIQAHGALMRTRVRVDGAPGAPRLRAEDLEGSGAADCSIAMQIKQLAGAEIAEVHNVPPPPVAPVPPPVPAPAATAPGTTAAGTPPSTAPAPAAPP